MRPTFGWAPETETMDTLAAAVVTSGGETTRTLLVLHGTYGRGRNWSRVARELVGARPEWAAYLVDLRLHGDSPAMAPPHTVRRAAEDVAALAEAQGLSVDAVLGHSLGGKVALALAGIWRDRRLQVWVIDAAPGARAPSGDAWQMLASVRALPASFASRAEAAEALEAQGWRRDVALWMATNLATRDGRLFWRTDFDAIESLLADFFATDLWQVLESPAEAHDIQVVKALSSDVISEETAERIGRAPRVRLHRVRGGHWLNAENPEALVTLLADGLV